MMVSHQARRHSLLPDKTFVVAVGEDAFDILKNLDGGNFARGVAGGGKVNIQHPHERDSDSDEQNKSSDDDRPGFNQGNDNHPGAEGDHGGPAGEVHEKIDDHAE